MNVRTNATKKAIAYMERYINHIINIESVIAGRDFLVFNVKQPVILLGTYHSV